MIAIIEITKDKQYIVYMEPTDVRVCAIIIYFYASLMYFYASNFFIIIVRFICFYYYYCYVLYVLDIGRRATELMSPQHCIHISFSVV